MLRIAVGGRRWNSSSCGFGVGWMKTVSVEELGWIADSERGNLGLFKVTLWLGSKSSSEGTTGATQKTHSRIISARHCGDASLPAIKQNCIYLGIMFNLIRVNLCTSVTPLCFQKQIHLDRYASQAAGVIKADKSLCRAHGKATRSAGHRDASFPRTMHPKSLYELSKHYASFRLCGLACAEISLSVRMNVEESDQT